MSTVTDAKASLVDNIAAVGVDVVGYVPEELPGGVIAVVEAAEDYLTPGETYATFAGGVDYWLNVVVYLLVDLAGNQQATEDLDGALDKVLPAIEAAGGWQLDRVGKPGPFHTTTWLAHGIPLHVHNLITIAPPTGEA